MKRTAAATTQKSSFCRRCRLSPLRLEEMEAGVIGDWTPIPVDKDDPRSEAGGTDRSFSRMEGFPGNTMSPSRSANTAPPAGCSTETAAGSCNKQRACSSASEGSFLLIDEYSQRRYAAEAHASLPSSPTHIAHCKHTHSHTCEHT